MTYNQLLGVIYLNYEIVKFFNWIKGRAVQYGVRKSVRLSKLCHLYLHGSWFKIHVPNTFGYAEEEKEVEQFNMVCVLGLQIWACKISFSIFLFILARINVSVLFWLQVAANMLHLARASILISSQLKKKNSLEAYAELEKAQKFLDSSIGYVYYIFHYVGIMWTVCIWALYLLKYSTRNKNTKQYIKQDQSTYPNPSSSPLFIDMHILIK